LNTELYLSYISLINILIKQRNMHVYRKNCVGLWVIKYFCLSDVYNLRINIIAIDNANYLRIKPLTWHKNIFIKFNKNKMKYKITT